MARRPLMTERMIGIAPFVAVLASGGMLALLMPDGPMRGIVFAASLLAMPVIWYRRRAAERRERQERAAQRRR